MPTSERSAAVAYLTPACHDFWKLDERGEAFTWRDGRTILFCQELAGILRALGDRPLPPFGALLLVTAATRDHWSDASAADCDQLQQLLVAAPLQGFLSSGSRTKFGEQWKQLFADLAAVRALPEDLRQSPAAKAELLALLGEGSKQNEETTTVVEVLAALERGAHLEEQASDQMGEAASQASLSLLRVYNWLRLGLPKVDAQRLALRRATGLDALPLPAPVVLPAQQIRSLIHELSQDQELAGLARLARHLMATVFLPRPLDQRDELPLGGVSDISNRGPLDKLLLSELAHDDLTLSVRVAMNEALYLRRESPPRQPPRTRRVLLDAGLRMWGLPRVYATAVALALAATTDADLAADVLRADDDAWEPVDLTSRAGLIAHFGALAVTAHPGAALATLEINGAVEQGSVDTVLITSQDTLEDPAFDRHLASLELSHLHVATVDRSGGYRLFQVTRHARRPIREAQFSLDEILAGGDSTSLVDASATTGEPAIFKQPRFPLRLSHGASQQGEWGLRDQGVYTITHDRRLLWWYLAGVGGYQVTDELPAGPLHWSTLKAAADHQVFAVIGKLSNTGLHVVTIDSREQTCQVRRLPLIGATPRSVAGYQGVIYVFFPDHVEAFDCATGVLIGRLPLTPTIRPLQGRFVRVSDVPGMTYAALAFDGQKIDLEPVPILGVRDYRVEAIFDVHDVPGPVVLLPTGELYFTSTETSRRINGLPESRYSIHEVSRDGSRFVVRDHPRQGQSIVTYYVVSVAEAQCLRTARWPLRLAEPMVADLVKQREFRHRFQRIAATSDGSLALANARGKWSKFVVKQSALRLQDCEAPPAAAQIPFEDYDCSRRVGYRLRQAMWSDGSTAWIDSRGLLHLRSSDGGLPEASITLSSGELAGWLSNHRVWGSEYYLGRSPDFYADEFERSFLLPFLGRLPC